MILFRQLTDPVPPDWTPGLHWQVEYHDDAHDVTYPLGIAWVTAYTGGVDAIGPYLDFILVADHCRRQGIARQLIAACRERWPGITLTDAISPAGEGLLRAVED